MQISSRGQLAAQGYTWSMVQSNIDAQRWRRLSAKVVCRHNAALTFEEACVAAYLNAPPPAALCGPTALAWWGIVGFPDPAVHVVVCRGATPAPVSGLRVRVHESRRFTDADVVMRRDIGVTTVERSALDTAAWAPDPLTAARVVVAAVQQRRTHPARLLRQLAGSGRIRHSSLLRRLLLDMSGGAEALSEVELVRFCRRHGLPRPQVQVRLDAGGRRRYLDAVLRGPGGRTVGLEIDGGVHLDLATRWRDTRKDNWAVIRGHSVLRFPSIALYTHDAEAVAQIRAALDMSGPRQVVA